jgi:ubiquinone/menaquinone biosynthesis C-methylase UbiE
MTLTRVPEPELMDSATEADDYDRMDFSEVNARFASDARASFGDACASAAVLDLGTGTGRIPLLYAASGAPARLVALDAAPAMVARAEENRRAVHDGSSAAAAARVVFVLGDATRPPFVDASFDAVMSNSLVHHLPDPVPFFAAIARVLAPGGRAFVRDLARPESEAVLEAQTNRYAAIPVDAAGEELARFTRQRALFHASLQAAFTVDEVSAMAEAAGLRGAAVRMTSDRHWTLTWTKP